MASCRKGFNKSVYSGVTYFHIVDWSSVFGQTVMFLSASCACCMSAAWAHCSVKVVHDKYDLSTTTTHSASSYLSAVNALPQLWHCSTHLLHCCLVYKDAQCWFWHSTSPWNLCRILVIVKVMNIWCPCVLFCNILLPLCCRPNLSAGLSSRSSKSRGSNRSRRSTVASRARSSLFTRFSLHTKEILVLHISGSFESKDTE